MTLEAAVRDAIRCGPVPELRSIDEIAQDTDAGLEVPMGEQIILFAARHLVVPEGMMYGKPLILLPFQQAFVRSVFDNPEHTRYAYLSIAARNGKTMLLAVILLAFIIGPLAQPNISVASGAMSREQAGLCFNIMHKILMASPDCNGLWSAVPSSKRIIGLSNNAEYVALSADAKTGYGRSLKVVLLDEAGLVVGPSSDFTSMLDTRQGSWDDALFLAISTQAPSDVDYFSVRLDEAERSQDPNTVSHVYKADDGCDLMDEEQWYRANPGLGVFRSLKDMGLSMKKAAAIPTEENKARNQFLNNRISTSTLAFSPTLWKECADPIDFELFRNGFVTMGLDLSAKNDLTAAVLCTETEDGTVHVLPYVFCPTVGIEDRSRRDRAPYDLWVREGHMMPVGGKTMDFDQIADTLAYELSGLGIEVDEIHYDKHMIDHFHAACDRAGVFTNSEWIGVPQFFKDMGVRLASCQGLLIENKLRHGGHPVLTMSASVAIAKMGREGISALAKDLSTQRIDPVVALVMAAWPFGDGKPAELDFDVSQYVA